jgi:hypothetical protein
VDGVVNLVGKGAVPDAVIADHGKLGLGAGLGDGDVLAGQGDLTFSEGEFGPLGDNPSAAAHSGPLRKSNFLLSIANEQR